MRGFRQRDDEESTHKHDFSKDTVPRPNLRNKSSNFISQTLISQQKAPFFGGVPERDHEESSEIFQTPFNGGIRPHQYNFLINGSNEEKYHGITSVQFILETIAT